MVMPPVWWDKEHIGMGEGHQCMPGFSIDDLPAGKHAGTSCFWFTNDTFIPHSPSLDNSMRTYRDAEIFPGLGPLDYTKNNPWRSPGSAHVHSPCGNAGGNPNGCPIGSPRGEGFDCPGGGWSHGPNAEDYPFEDVPVTQWKSGDVVEVGWGIVANHGGGYSYRLCKVPQEGISHLTEKCFQETPLDFVGDVQWVQYGLDEHTRIPFIANRTRKGTYPRGSQWTKNPIPACYPFGGFYSKECKELQFSEPAPGLSGFGIWIKNITNVLFKFHIIDKVKIPSNLEPGYYVLSFRWDCEQTPQIWNGCSDIKLVNDGYERNNEKEEILHFLEENFKARSIPEWANNSLFLCFAVILAVLFLLWVMYCVMLAMVRCQRKRDYENVNETDPLL